MLDRWEVVVLVGANLHVLMRRQSGVPHGVWSTWLNLPATTPAQAHSAWSLVEGRLTLPDVARVSVRVAGRAA